MGRVEYKKRIFDVRADRLDLRDRIYQPLLKSLPNFYPSVSHLKRVLSFYKKYDLVLDQKKYGACTGFALASLINYLLLQKKIARDFSKKNKDSDFKKVSPKMLYNLAKIYDEWDGEDYEGSSCRGAMKGWHHHGVCYEDSWRFEEEKPKSGWEKEAIKNTLGSYYRVDKNSLNDMQSALYEVGVLYVSSFIHDGWWNLRVKNKDINHLAVIPYQEFAVAKHAFLIVGYTKKGFIIQNSWGKEWGNYGFAMLLYKDWLEHGLDVWVAVMGTTVEVDKSSQMISTLSLSAISNDKIEGAKPIKEALNYNYKDKRVFPVSEEKAYNHTLVLTANARVKHTVISTFDIDESIKDIIYIKVKKWLEKKEENFKVTFVAIGGFDKESDLIARIRVLIPYFLQNNIYPLFLSWQQDYFGILARIIDKYILELFKDNTNNQKVYNSEALDRAIESFTHSIETRGIWVEIKQKSYEASMDRVVGFKDKKMGILKLICKSFERLQRENLRFELHAIAFSLNSELLATSWLGELSKSGLKLKTMHLIAPTMSIQSSCKYLLKAFRDGVIKKSELYIYMLNRELERSDEIGKYKKSFLYLVNRSLEKLHKTPILGLEDSWIKENTYKKDGVFNTQHIYYVKKWIREAFEKDDKCKIFFFTREHMQLVTNKEYKTVKITHTNLIKSIFLFEKILKVILTGNEDGKLLANVENLV